jgi:glycerol 3-phosphatase-2
LPWVATNLDATVPSPRGPLPGNGSLVAALRHATGAAPVSTGKPDPAMHRETVERSGARRPLVVGDRLDTDIEGANAVGCASMLVLTGVTSATDLLAAPGKLRPSYIAHGLNGLLEGHPAPETAEGTVSSGGWSVRIGHELRLATLPGQTGGVPLDALRGLCVAAWRTGVTRCAADDEYAAAVLNELGLRRSSAA